MRKKAAEWALACIFFSDSREYKFQSWRQRHSSCQLCGGGQKKKAICSILHFYSNHQISHGFPLKYKNENKLPSNAQGKIRKMWFVLLLFLYSSNMSVPTPPRPAFFLKNDTYSHSRCSKSVFQGGVSNQQDSVLYLEAVMRSDRARGLSVFLHRQWRGWNTQLIGSGLHNATHQHDDMADLLWGSPWSCPHPGLAQFCSTVIVF